MTRVAIIGSRPEYNARDRARDLAIQAYVKTLPQDTIFVSGGGSGADLWAQRAADRCGLQLVIFPAPWKRRDGSQDLSAGPRRNVLIAEYADRCVAFYGGAAKSTGTDHCVAQFRRLGKPVDARRP